MEAVEGADARRLWEACGWHGEDPPVDFEASFVVRWQWRLIAFAVAFWRECIAAGITSPDAVRDLP